MYLILPGAEIGLMRTADAHLFGHRRESAAVNRQHISDCNATAREIAAPIRPYLVQLELFLRDAANADGPAQMPEQLGLQYEVVAPGGERFLESDPLAFQEPAFQEICHAAATFPGWGESSRIAAAAQRLPIGRCGGPPPAPRPRHGPHPRTRSDEMRKKLVASLFMLAASLSPVAFAAAQSGSTVEASVTVSGGTIDTSSPSSSNTVTSTSCDTRTCVKTIVYIS